MVIYLKYLAPLVTLAGLLMYWFGNAKVVRLGEIMFFCGLFVTLLGFTTGTLKLP